MGGCAEDGLPELVRPERVAEWLGLDRRGVYLMVTRGEFPPECIVHIGRRLRFDAESLRSWLAEKRTSSRPSAK